MLLPCNSAIHSDCLPALFSVVRPGVDCFVELDVSGRVGVVHRDTETELGHNTARRSGRLPRAEVAADQSPLLVSALLGGAGFPARGFSIYDFLSSCLQRRDGPVY